MKNIISYFLIAFSILIFSSCEKEENKITLEGATAPVLSADKNNPVLAPGSEALQAIQFFWTNPNYRTNLGPSSQDVNYKFEMDSTSSFSNPNRYVLNISRDLSRSFTVAQLNDILGNTIKIPVDVTKTIYVRVTATLGSSGGAPVTSNVFQFTTKAFTPPPKVVTPPTNRLWITGAATPAGWMSNGSTPVAAQEFTRVSNTLYRLASINLNANEEYLLVPDYGNWGAPIHKYGSLSGPNNVNTMGDDFRVQGDNLKAPSIGGAYRIEVNFQDGKFKLEKL